MEKKTIIDLFESSAKRFPSNPFLWEKTGKRFEPTTYAEVRDLVYEEGAGLISLGVRKGDNMALLSEGRNAWIIGELAMFYAGRELMDELGADEPCIGKFGLLQAGTVCNAVAGEAHVAGSLRVFTDDMFDRAREGVRRVLDDACAATGCTYDLDFAEGYPPVDNDPELFASVAPALPGLQLMEEPLLIAEDFAFYQRHLPGVFFLLGTGMPEGQDNLSDSDGCPAYATSALHTDSMLFDEEILLTGLDVYKRLLVME